ncbi:mite group 2 allergen Lep d 2 [Tetranychus urticae]|uniref:MD-2-related lipid-recognition domain-containing protein n=1 Tax=Tetranychus urticae TaxID=32264 RepID=T1KLD7_TETUR|nr:mite group 2 allergen Lep d 2 [Tetranychus urticae]
MIRTIAIVALFLAYAQARNITFSNCSPNGKINFVNVIPCEAEPCTFKTGDEVHLNGQYKTSIAASKPTLKAEIKVDGEWVEYPEVESDACKYTSCPIEANVAYPYVLDTNVIDWPESFATEMRFRLFADDGKTELICGSNAIVVVKA